MLDNKKIKRPDDDKWSSLMLYYSFSVANIKEYLNCLRYSDLEDFYKQYREWHPWHPEFRFTEWVYDLKLKRKVKKVFYKIIYCQDI